MTAKTTAKATAKATAMGTPKAKARPQKREEDHDGVDVVNKQEQFILPLFNPVAERYMWPFGISEGNRLHIGSGCSGLDSFMYALKHLGFNEVQVKLQSCSEIDKKRMMILQTVYKPMSLNMDITQRNHAVPTSTPLPTPLPQRDDSKANQNGQNRSEQGPQQTKTRAKANQGGQNLAALIC